MMLAVGQDDVSGPMESMEERHDDDGEDGMLDDLIRSSTHEKRRQDGYGCERLSSKGRDRGKFRCRI